MKNIFIFFFFLFVCTIGKLQGQETTILSPDNKLSVQVFVEDSKAFYSIHYAQKVILEKSPLGIKTNITDFSTGLKLMGQKDSIVDKTYNEEKIKTSKVHYLANEKTCSFENLQGKRIDIIFLVSNNNVAFRYFLPQEGETACCRIERELSGFKFPSFATTFLTPQAPPMTGWKRTKPSYEEEYIADEAIGTSSKYGIGYTLPALFHIGDNGWALVSETGVNSLYCGSKLSEASEDGTYTITFPEQGENHGIGASNPSISLPSVTPWRTITVGDNLKPIVETTIPFDLVEPLYKPSIDYKFGRSTWSWIMWQDNSINFEDQKTYIDLSSDLGYEYVLVDGLWDAGIGKEKIEELAEYARSKNVELCLWYNSNGYWNDAPQGPKNKMNTSIARKQEMAWMKSIGVKGIKVDFFGGDKQETFKLYEDILSDANDYGLFVIFHGCTLPRGWDRMFPNFAGSEAVLASENLIFNQYFNDVEAYNASLHPFIRNSVGAMEFGPVLLNKRHNRNNDGGTIRKTTDVFQIATAVLFQNPVQNFAIAPNNLSDNEDFIIDFMKKVPTIWDETIFIDGYPGRYCILARRHQDKWYIVGVNAEKDIKEIKVTLPMLSGKKVLLYSDKANGAPLLSKVNMNASGETTLKMQPNGGIVLTNED